MQTLPLRLSPGQDLRTSLEAVLAKHDVSAAFVLQGIGSLSVAQLGPANNQIGRCVQAKTRAGKACDAAKAGALARRTTLSSVRFGLNPEGMGLKHRMALLGAACLDHQAARHPPSHAMFWTHSHTQFDC
jgi:hypothetical protein